MTIDPRLFEKAKHHPKPLLFATISGAHLYGFPSPDSDWDLRGAHILPLPEVLKLDVHQETIEHSNASTMLADGIEYDIVSHDVKKFFSMMLKKNGYVLEQLFSPLVVQTSPEHAELKELGKDCITKFHSYHYLGFSQTEWKLFEKENPRRVKPLLYVFRVLLTGIHLMRTGIIEANLLRLNEEAKLPYIDDLVARKLGGKEQSTLPNADFAFFESEFHRLEQMLKNAHKTSQLPIDASAKNGLDDLLVRIRMKAA